ncbi:hypothetical protein M378DRAFT_796067 [Amanita muscaria Koide BX008]|uniref:Uncharacterized protein n=1 Tax=Amanita muscaria (strain Koide BX008) TaxID=946122 RepID=A0A0C2X0W3_AMAMK|nr:hypothetical protein M378DRAFT_796067 [Amanita muscaria Koide BX008]
MHPPYPRFISFPLMHTESNPFSFSLRMEFDLDTIEEEDSPYSEVRASVSNIDDPDMPAMTTRMYLVCLLLCMANRSLFASASIVVSAPSTSTQSENISLYHNLPNFASFPPLLLLSSFVSSSLSLHSFVL